MVDFPFDFSAADMALEQRLQFYTLLSPDQWRVARIEAQMRHQSLRQILPQLGFVSESVLAELESQGANTPVLDLSQVILDPHLSTLLARTIAERYQILPLFQEGSTLSLGMVYPKNLLARDKVRTYCSSYTSFAYYRITPSHFKEGLSKIYDYDCSLEGLFQEMDRSSTALDKNGYENPTVRLAHILLLEAVHAHASDIHLEPEKSFIRVRHRIDGRLVPKITFHERHWKALCVRLKWMADLDIAETRFPQSGRFSNHLAGRHFDFRLSTHPTTFGENVVIRLLDKTHGIHRISTLGFHSTTQQRLKKIAQNPQGLVVITGPTGSGKTTTLYALLSHRQALDCAIMTLEQPVEYQLPLIRQTEIQERGRLTFAEGVRSLLRQDLDVLLVGEIRDHETAKATVRAAMTGHQVYTTLHVGEALAVIQRLMDLGIPLEDFLPHLTHILHQRLIRRRCPHCLKEEFPKTICPLCKGGGYHGRIPLLEIVTMDDALRSLILKKTPWDDIRHYQKLHGFQSLWQQASLLIQQGETTVEEALHVLGPSPSFTH